MANLNYCQVCGKWLGMDDYDGICAECDSEICSNCGGEGDMDSGGWTPWGWPVNVVCPRCNGTGKEPDTAPDLADHWPRLDDVPDGRDVFAEHEISGSPD